MRQDGDVSGAALRAKSFGEDRDPRKRHFHVPRRRDLCARRDLSRRENLTYFSVTNECAGVNADGE